jgi:hypothetical protein
MNKSILSLPGTPLWLPACAIVVRHTPQNRPKSKDSQALSRRGGEESAPGAAKDGFFASLRTIAGLLSNCSATSGTGRGVGLHDPERPQPDLEHQPEKEEQPEAPIVDEDEGDEPERPDLGGEEVGPLVRVRN